MTSPAHILNTERLSMWILRTGATFATLAADAGVDVARIHEIMRYAPVPQDLAQRIADVTRIPLAQLAERQVATR